MKKVIFILSLFFTVSVKGQEVYGYMMRIKSDSFTYKSAMRNKYLFLDTSGEFKTPTRKDHHILRICIPANRQNEFPILSTYFSCSNLNGIKVLLTTEMINKIRAVIQSKYK